MRLLALVLLLAVSRLPLVAQPTGGIKVGANAAYHVTTDYDDASLAAISGFVGGVFLSAPLGERFAIQPEILYSQLGTEIRGAYHDRLHLHEITLPLLLKVFLVKKYFHIHAGPQIAVVTNSRYASGRDVHDAFRANDYGVVAGLGVNLPLRLTLDARYVYGLPDMIKYRPYNVPTTTKQQQHAIQLLLGLRLF